MLFTKKIKCLLAGCVFLFATNQMPAADVMPGQFIIGQTKDFTQLFIFTEGTSFLQGLLGQGTSSEQEMEQAIEKLNTIITKLNQIQDQLNALQGQLSDFVKKYDEDQLKETEQNIAKIRQSVSMIWTQYNDIRHEYKSLHALMSKPKYAYMQVWNRLFDADSTKALALDAKALSDQDGNSYFLSFINKLESNIPMPTYDHPIDIFTQINNFNSTLQSYALNLIKTLDQIYYLELQRYTRIWCMG